MAAGSRLRFKFTVINDTQYETVECDGYFQGVKQLNHLFPEYSLLPLTVAELG
jgi:hypothetical protein